MKKGTKLSLLAAGLIGLGVASEYSGITNFVNKTGQKVDEVIIGDRTFRAFERPNQITEAEAFTQTLISEALGCPKNSIPGYRTESGVIREPNITEEDSLLLISSAVACVGDGVGKACSAVGLLYDEGTHVGGFTSTGICLSSKHLDPAQKI